MFKILGLGTPYVLDLHQLSASEARAVVLCGILNLQQAFRGGMPPAADLVINTGVLPLSNYAIGLRISGPGDEIKAGNYVWSVKNVLVRPLCAGMGRADICLRISMRWNCAISKFLVWKEYTIGDGGWLQFTRYHTVPQYLSGIASSAPVPLVRESHSSVVNIPEWT
jgi:hypothetical protein